MLMFVERTCNSIFLQKSDNFDKSVIAYLISPDRCMNGLIILQIYKKYLIRSNLLQVLFFFSFVNPLYE